MTRLWWKVKVGFPYMSLMIERWLSELFFRSAQNEKGKELIILRRILDVWTCNIVPNNMVLLEVIIRFIFSDFLMIERWLSELFFRSAQNKGGKELIILRRILDVWTYNIVPNNVVLLEVIIRFIFSDFLMIERWLSELFFRSAQNKGGKSW